MQLESREKYLLALGGFRRAQHALMLAAAGLRRAADEMDPGLADGGDPTTDAIFGECLTELRGMAALMPGFRHLLELALLPADAVEETAAPHENCEAH